MNRWEGVTLDIDQVLRASIGVWHEPQPELCSAECAVGTSLLYKAILARESEHHKTLLPCSKAVTSQGSKLNISFTLKPLQRFLREVLLTDCSCLLDLCCLTSREQHSGIQGSYAHHAILTQLRCRRCNSPQAEYSTLTAAAGFLIIDAFQKIIVISSLSSQTWWQERTGRKLFWKDSLE